VCYYTSRFSPIETRGSITCLNLLVDVVCSPETRRSLVAVGRAIASLVYSILPAAFPKRFVGDR
jgi:hypothetical protein